MERLKDKVAIITGGTSGIGRACAVAFSREGAQVVIAGRRSQVGHAIAASLGERSMFVTADVTREDDIKALVERTLERCGRIDCVISNAGSASATGTIADTDPKALAKAALAHLTRCAAIELGEMGIRVNSISPGPTRTGIFAKAGGVDHDAADQSMEAVEAAFVKLLPAVQALPGMIHAEDIANAAVFLASDEARFINGHDLVIDGGITAGRPAATMKAGWQALADGLQSAGAGRARND